MKSKVIAVPYVVWAVIFIVVPSLFVAYFAFTDSHGSFTLENISKMGKYMNVFGRSVAYAAAATVLCLVFGYLLAYFMAHLKERQKSICLVLLMLPMWINLVLRTQALQNILMDNGIINRFLGLLNIPSVKLLDTSFAVILGLIYNYLPFMVLPVFTSLEKLDNKIIEAAQDLGADSRKVFTKVILPLSMPGVYSGIIMVFIPCLSTFVISEKLGGGKVYLIGNVINDMFNQNYNFNVGAAISLVMMFIMILTLIVFSFLDDETKEGIL